MTTPRDKTRARETQALTLRAQGKTLESIARELNFANASGVSKALDRVLARQAALSADQLRAMADAELDDLQRKLHALLGMQGTNIDQAVKIIDQIRKVQERRAKLHGLDAGRLVTVSEPATDPSVRPNDFDRHHRGFHLVIDADAVDRRLLPWKHMAINPRPGEGTLPPPTPSIIVEPALLPPEALRQLIAEGALHVDGIFFSIPAEHVSDELLDALAEAEDHGNDDGYEDDDDA